MKYGILPFIIVVALAGCNSKHSGDQAATTTDSIPHMGGLFDSVHDAKLRGEVMKDYIDLLSVKHVLVNGNAIEQVLYVDHNANRSEKTPMINDYPGFASVLAECVDFMPNPLPEMNGRYTSAFSYKGKDMTANIGDAINSDEMIVRDSAIIWIPDGLDFLLYKSGERTGDKVTYVVSDQDKSTDTIEIKMLKGDLKMQIWKWTKQGDIKDSLRVPQDKIGSVPAIVAENNTGLDGNMEVTFDKIDYDALWAGK